MLTPGLLWIRELQGSINRATGGQIRSHTVITGADPLRAFVKLDLHESLAGNDYHPFCHLARGFAAANGCVLERVHRGESSLTLEIALKRRLGPKQESNPLLSKKA